MTTIIPTPGELQDALAAEEDVRLVENGVLTHAGEFYVAHLRANLSGSWEDLQVLQSLCYHDKLSRIGDTDGKPDFACDTCEKVF